MAVRGGSRTLARGLMVLRVLGEVDAGATVAELSSATTLDRAVLYRLLDTLCTEGFARRDDDTRRYHLGVALVDLGVQAATSLEVRRLAQPHMKKLMIDSGEAVCLAVRDGDELVVVGREEPEGLFVRVGYGVGMRHALLRGAHGRALAAFLNSDELAVLPGAVAAAGRLDQVRERGYAMSSDELETGTTGVAAPIRDRDGQAIASIGVVAPTPRLDDPDALGEALHAAAAEISQQLGFLATAGA